MISKRYSEVYGGAAGQARQTHLRKAWTRLYPDATKTNPKGKKLAGRTGDLAEHNWIFHERGVYGRSYRFLGPARSP